MTEHAITCSGCGNVTTILCDAPRKASTGSGCHDADQVKTLTLGQQFAFQVLKDKGCFSAETGLESRQVYDLVKPIYSAHGLPWPVLSTPRSELSRLAGPGLRIVKCEKVKAELEDPATRRFRYRRPIHWYIPEGGLTRFELMPKVWIPTKYEQPGGKPRVTVITT